MISSKYRIGADDANAPEAMWEYFNRNDEANTENNKMNFLLSNNFCLLLRKIKVTIDGRIWIVKPVNNTQVEIT